MKCVKSKLKRCHNQDYHNPCIYLITVTVEDRKPVLSKVVGNLVQTAVELTEVGRAVKKEIFAMEERYPQVKLLQYQIMPDHVHLILHVKERLPEKLPLGNLVAAWKQACGKAYSALLERDLKASQRDGQDGAYEASSREATFRSQEGPKPPYTPLFSKGFNDRILTGRGQLSLMIAYVKDNPRRFLIKQQHHGFFTIHRGLSVAGMHFDAVGNLSLLQKPKVAVHCRRRWKEAEQEAFAEGCLCKAEDGTVLVGAFISKAEKEIAQKANERHFPLIRLVENGFNEFFKPVGQDFYSCAEGRLLLLAPRPYHNDTKVITREQCGQLNAMAEHVSNNISYGE